MSFLDEDFLLPTAYARTLYHEVAAPAPIVDFHNHLSPQAIADNQRFHDIVDLWLNEDHYKWRLMRAVGVPERLITDRTAPSAERFAAFAHALALAPGNSLYSWSHLELRRVFGIEEILTPHSAARIRDRANAILRERAVTTRSLIAQFNVTMLGTTDDPTDDLQHHARLNKEADLGFRMRPTFRPDRALAVDRPQFFRDWIRALETVADAAIDSPDALMSALAKRLDFFIACGGRMADHGLDAYYAYTGADDLTRRAFAEVITGRVPSPECVAAWRAFVMHRLAGLYAARGITQQLHVGPRRNVNSAQFQRLGPDVGFDVFGSPTNIEEALRYFDRLSTDGILPRTIVFNLNPADNEPLLALCGAFPNVSYGPAWWFLDQKEGMLRQLQGFAEYGALGTFVGMVTDSRSFLSFTRHEYFRRLFCRFLGNLAEEGEIPADPAAMGGITRAVCSGNAAAMVG